MKIEVYSDTSKYDVLIAAFRCKKSFIKWLDKPENTNIKAEQIVINDNVMMGFDEIYNILYG